jgi:hypothetical protein
MAQNTDMTDLDEVDLAILDTIEDISEFGPSPRAAAQLMRERISIIADNIEDFFIDASSCLGVGPLKH